MSLEISYFDSLDFSPFNGLREQLQTLKNKSNDRDRQLDDIRRQLADLRRQLADLRRRLAKQDRQLADIEREVPAMMPLEISYLDSDPFNDFADLHRELQTLKNEVNDQDRQLANRDRQLVDVDPILKNSTLTNLPVMIFRTAIDAVLYDHGFNPSEGWTRLQFINNHLADLEPILGLEMNHIVPFML